MTTNLIIACVLSGVASLALGFLWYHPKVFGTAWMNETGLTPEDAQKGNMPMIFGLTFLICAFMAYHMKWINHPDPLPAIAHGMYHGAMNVGIFGVGALIVNALFEQKSFKYILINASYWLAVFAVIGAILASFPSLKPAPAEEDKSSSMQMEQMDYYIGERVVMEEDVYVLV